MQPTAEDSSTGQGTTSGVNRFGHILSAIPPLISADFCRGRDTAVLDTYSEIQRCTYPRPCPVFSSPPHQPGRRWPGLPREARQRQLFGDLLPSRWTPACQTASHGRGCQTRAGSTPLQAPGHPDDSSVGMAHLSQL